MAKKYHTIDELLEQSRMNESDNFSVGDGKSYHTIDEIKSAAEKQGLLPQSDTRVAAPVVYSKQAKPSTAKLDPMIAARERVARVATQTAGAVGSGIISSIINSRQNMNPILRKAAEERVKYERNAASSLEKLQKEVDAPIDLYDVHDVQLALSNIPDVHETAEWFVKYRRGGVLRSDENIAKYNKIKELIDQNVSSARIARSQEYADKIAYEGEDGKSVNYNDLMIGKVAQNRIQDIGLSPDDARRQLYELNTGNYNVMDSQPVNMQALQSAGWNVTGDMTNFTQPVSDDDTHKAAVFSPVVYDDKGNVSKILSPQELDAYALKVLRGEDDTLNLKITDTYEGRYASSLASENAQRVRRLSERAYNDTDFTPLLHDAGTVPGEDSSAAKQKLKEAGVDWDEYLTYQQREDEIKRSQQAVQNYANWSTQNAGTATLATGANILMSPGKALDYLVNIVGNAVDRVKAGDNKFSVYNLPDTADDWATNLSGASGEAITESIRSGVRGNGDNVFLNWLGDAAANTYGGVTSGIQSALTHATCFALLPPGVAEATSLTIMSGEAANDAYHEVLDNGGTIGQATMYSVAAGVNEYIGEKISLENLLDMKQMFGKQKAKEIIIGILKQGIVEGSEEVVTENLNEFADRVINADKSQYERSVQMYLEQGYQEDEARKKASQDFYARVAWAGYGGFIGGIFPGVGKTALNTFKSKLDYDQYTNTVGSAVQEAGNTQKLIDQAYAMDDKKIKAQADKAAKYDAKQGQGNVVTNLYNEHKAKKETGKLYASIQENNISRVASAEETEIKTALSKAYAEKIKADVNDKSVSKVVDALYKSEYTNEPLSRSEQRMISSDNAKAALSDVQSNEDVIRSQINRAQRRATEDMASTAALTGTKEQATEKPAKIDIDDFNLSDDGKTYTADGGEQVDIKSISSVDADDIRVELSNGKTESVKALDLGSEDQAVVYQGIMDIQTRLGAPVTASFANAVVNEYNQAKASDANLSTTDFIYGVEEAVRKGYMNDNGGNYAVNLSESAREALFDEGRKIAQEHTKAQQKSVQSRIKGENSQRKGTVTYEDGIERSQMNERQQVGVDVVTHIAEETGIDVVFFRSTKDGKGRYSSNFITKNGFSENGQAPNGFWHNGKMYIDVNAGMNGEGLILFTAAHEIVHMIREGSPESFKALADFLVENYAKKGVDVNKLVLKEMTRSTNLNYDQAFEEVIAQSCESLLRDIHQSPEMAKKLYQKDKGLAAKIKNILNRILNAVKKWYGVAKPQSVEANYVLEMKDALSEIYDRYIAGIRAASENLRNIEKTADEGGIKNQFRGVTETGYEVYETSKELKGKSYSEKLAIFESAFYDENSPLYFGSKIRFEKNGNLLYAEIDRHTKNEILHKINPSHLNQWDKAKINIGASGDLVTLMESALFDREEINNERTKNDAHKRTAIWEYYAKSIYVDSKPFDVVVNIRREDSGRRFVYDVKLKQNKNLPQLDPQAKLSRRSKVQSTRLSGRFAYTIPQTENEINREYSDIDTKFSIREEAPPKNTVTGYKVFRIKDGKLYPPMVANPGGADTPVGVWLNADVGERAPDSKTGRAQVKGKGGMSLSFRPGWHLGDIPRASQFDRKNPETGVKDMFPSDFVWAECDCAADVDYQEEAMSYGYTDNGKFRHAYAGLPRVPENGYYKYRTNPRPDTVPWIITGAIKVNRILSDAEVAEILEKNGVKPPERQGGNKTLEELGLNNEHIKRQSRSDSDYLSAVKRGDMKTVQSMVDEAAEAVGYTVKAYHSGENGITKFQSGNSAGLIYFAFSKQSAKKAARSNKAIYSAFLSIQKPVNTRDSAIDWYYAEDGLKVAQWRREGFDSVYVKDEAGISVAVFNPEQVKSADPVTYDDNGDVIPLSERFNESNKDIRFSLRDNVEETRDLIAVHNLTEEKLLKSLRLGGLPMPSVAVIKAENGHKGYGDISIVFPKETIDPSENRNNKLYGGDVWSPTYPSIDYEVDTKKANKIYTRAREALRKPAAYSLNPVTFHPENIADRINSYGGEQGFIEHYKNDYGMKQFYLAEQNQAVPERYVEKRNEISDVDKEFYSFLADQLGKEAFSQEATKTGREWNNRYADDLDNARIDYMRSVYGELSKEEEENLRRDFESERPVHKFRIARSVQGYLENGGVTVERKLDEDGIKADIDKLVDQSKYEEWLKELFNGIEKSSGIYNGTDYYTSSGNRRSFAQTHYTETLANVVRVMKSQDNGDSFFGGNGLWAIAAKNYGTIEEMKADKDRLTNLSDEERQEISNRFGERFTEIASSIANDGDNEFLALDNAYGNICDAVRNTNTKSGLLRELQKYHHKATVATVDDILDLVSDVGNMPVNYFEAKPQRAIKFNEVSTAVIPDNASQALRTALDKAGVKYVEYASGNEEARTEILNSLEDVKFQSRDDDLYFGETDDAFDIDFGEDDSVENLIAREFVTHHEDMGEVLRNVADIELTPKKVESIVNRVIRDHLGRLDAEARHTLSIKLQLALERVNVDDPQTVSDEIIGAVHKAIEGSTVVDDKAVSNYNQLRDAFKGKKFYLTDEQVNQLKEHDMTLDSYRRAMMGKVTIVKRENAKRSISGGYADANELSLMGLHDVLESPDEVLGFRSWEWDEKGYDAPNIIKKAFETLRDRREQPITNVYSDEAIDERAVAIAAKITGGIVEAKYNSKQNPYVTKLVADLKQKRTEAVNKQKEKNRQKLAELKQKERERAEKREQDIRQKYRERRARGYENRKRTELRGKIRKLMNSFQSRLTKPHDGSYVPRELISRTVEILNSINMDTGRSAKLSEKIAALRNTYDGLKEDAQAYAAYDDTISAMLRGLSESLGNTSIMNMSLEQLKQTYDTLRSLDHYIRESVKMTDTDEKRTAHQLGREMIAETKDVPKEHSGLLSGYIQTQLRADVMFNRLAGFKKNSTWSQMARMLNDGQLHMTQLQMEFSRIFADVLTDTKQLRTLSDTKHLVDVGLVDDDGNKVPITRGMMLSLYMHLLNEDNMRHVERGGLTIPSMKEYYKGDLAKAFGSGQRSVRVGMIDFSQYSEGIKTVIEEQLTDYEIEWIEKAREFFDGASREALNDTTMKLYHFKKANVDNYFPIHTDSNYRAASFESITRDMSLENSGFMKERIKASNPILLEDIVDVINDQIQKVSKYCGLTIPIKNFQKVYGTTLAGFETSLQKEINKKFSGSRSNTSATKYIDNLITDLTSGRQTSDGPTAKFFSMARGNLAAATLTLNVRVAIAQAASYPTAAAEIGWKPLLKAFVKGGKNNRMISGADRAYIEEHTPLLWLRTQGYSNTEIGDIKEIRKQRHQIEGKVKKALGWIEFFDGMTVGRLFYAAQYYVDEQFPTLKRGSEEYKQKVAEVYNDVIEKTQPNYTTMQRPDILRNPNALVKSLTMFMTQRLQNFNIVYDAVGTYNKYRKDLTAGKNGVTAQDLRQAKTKLRRAVVSQTVAALTIVGMKLFADMLMHSMNAYRDDDDELTAESVSLALLNNFADTIFGSVLFGSDLYSLLKSAISSERYYGISLSGVDSFTDAVEKIVNLRKGIDLDSANKAATAICQLMGIPLNNAEKIGKAIYNWGSDFSSGRFMEAGVDRTNKQNIHRAEMRYTSGNIAEAQKLLTAMIEQKKAEGKTDKEAKSWLRSQLTSTYKPRYVQAVKDNNTEERTAIRQFLYQSGAYGSLTDLDKALSKWVDK